MPFRSKVFKVYDLKDAPDLDRWEVMEEVDQVLLEMFPNPNELLVRSVRGTHAHGETAERTLGELRVALRPMDLASLDTVSIHVAKRIGGVGEPELGVALTWHASGDQMMRLSVDGFDETAVLGIAGLLQKRLDYRLAPERKTSLPHLTKLEEPRNVEPPTLRAPVGQTTTPEAAAGPRRQAEHLPPTTKSWIDRPWPKTLVPWALGIVGTVLAAYLVLKLGLG